MRAPARSQSPVLKEPRLICAILLSGSEERVRLKGRPRFFTWWNLPVRSREVPGPSFGNQMVDLPRPAIDMHTLVGLIGGCPKASRAGDVSRRYSFV